MKKLNSLFVFLTTFVTSTVAYAAFPGVDWASRQAEQGIQKFVDLGIAGAFQFGKYFLKYLEAMLIPKPLWVGIPLMVLTVVWMLGIEWIRKTVGRLSGLAWAIFIALASIQTFRYLVNWLPTWGKIILVIFVIMFSGVALMPVKWLASSIWTLAKSGWHGTEAGKFACGAGAVFAAGILNGQYASNPKTFYFPSFLSAAAGLSFLGRKLYKHLRDRPQQQRVQHTQTVEPQNPALPPTDPSTTSTPTLAGQNMVTCPTCRAQTMQANCCNFCGNALPQPNPQTASQSTSSSTSAAPPSIVVVCGRNFRDL